jgi:hypothetical protein
MNDKYSDKLPRFGRNRYRRDDRGIARFDGFIRKARRLRSRPRSRPGLKILAFAIIIGGLAYGVAERKNMLRLLGTRDRGLRTVVPLAVQLIPPPEWSQAETEATIARVQPKVSACVAAWPNPPVEHSGTYEVEIVLTKDGPVEAALSGMHAVPSVVARCVGHALGTAAWPAPKWLRKVRFSVVPMVPTP